MAQTLQSTPETLDEQQKFVYRPIPTSAPVAMVLGILSLAGPVTLYAMGISSVAMVFWTMPCLIAGVLGLLCLKKIRLARDSFSGDRLALGAVMLGGAAAVANLTVAAFLVATEVPEGYDVVNFTTDISKKGFGERQSLHPDVVALDGKKIFLTGYMYRGKQREGLQNFVLVKDNQLCCFGRQPSQADMVEVYLPRGEETDLVLGKTAVAGTFHAYNPRSKTTLSLQHKPIYRIEADICRPAKVNF